jgi:hypothetical protein
MYKVMIMVKVFMTPETAKKSKITEKKQSTANDTNGHNQWLSLKLDRRVSDPIGPWCRRRGALV